MTRISLLAALAVASLPSAALAQGRHAATADTWASTDADHTDVVKAGLNLDWVHDGEAKVRGFRLEQARFTPLGGKTITFERAYVRYGDRAERLSWNTQIGTDGHSVVGAATLVAEAGWRKEFFAERDILETPRGVSEGIYYTFAGAALDVPLGQRDSATVVAGAQAFTGRNVRLHARANYVHTVKREWGLTAQVRGRYFVSTVPGEFDYFSPKWYAEVLPVVQLRRNDGGWRYLVAAGYGGQRDSGSDWRASRYLNAQLSSPADRPIQLKATAVYANTPVGSGYVYDYLQGSLAVTTRF